MQPRPFCLWRLDFSECTRVTCGYHVIQQVDGRDVPTNQLFCSCSAFVYATLVGLDNMFGGLNGRRLQLET